ncbi:MAG: ATP-binding protein [Cyclobacteriaceae bacterium]|nr:ATP-binding protein [Cyclobacteriaceae bacterium]
MIHRQLFSQLQVQIRRFPVIGIVGPRQVGKTTLVKSLLNSSEKVIYLDLELPSDQAILRNPELFFRENMDKTIILDEIQLTPDMFPVMRSVIDMKRRPGKFIVTGSASPALLKQGSETLAGRIIFNELHPFSLSEIRADYRKLWLRGGFPAACQAKSNRVGFEWLSNFLATYINRDLSVLGFTSSRVQMSRFIQMLAGSQGSILNLSTYAKSLSVSVPLVAKYVDVLEETFLLRRLQAYHVNFKKRVVKSPKVYIRDTGLLHSMLRIDNMTELLSHFLAGYSWESFVIQQVASHLDNRNQLFYYRTQDGAEVDLVITKGDKPWVSLEIKLTDSPTLTKGNYIALTDIKAKHNFIVTPSSREYSFDKNIQVTNINGLITRLGDLNLFY